MSRDQGRFWKAEVLLVSIALKLLFEHRLQIAVLFNLETLYLPLEVIIWVELSLRRFLAECLLQILFILLLLVWADNVDRDRLIVVPGKEEHLVVDTSEKALLRGQLAFIIVGSLVGPLIIFALLDFNTDDAFFNKLFDTLLLAHRDRIILSPERNYGELLDLFTLIIDSQRSYIPLLFAVCEIDDWLESEQLWFIIAHLKSRVFIIRSEREVLSLCYGIYAIIIDIMLLWLIILNIFFVFNRLFISGVLVIMRFLPTLRGDESTCRVDDALEVVGQIVYSKLFASEVFLIVFFDLPDQLVSEFVLLLQRQ